MLMALGAFIRNLDVYKRQQKEFVDTERSLLDNISDNTRFRELYRFATPWAKATKRQINVNRMLGCTPHIDVLCYIYNIPRQNKRIVIEIGTVSYTHLIG